MDVNYGDIMADVSPENLLNTKAGYIKDGIFYTNSSVARYFFEQHKEQAKRNKPDQKVYFIRGADKIKIGISEYPNARLDTLQIGSPVKLEIVAVLFGGSELETELHKRFSHLYSHGEWFSEDQEIYDYIDSTRNR